MFQILNMLVLLFFCCVQQNYGQEANGEDVLPILNSRLYETEEYTNLLKIPGKSSSTLNELRTSINHLNKLAKIDDVMKPKINQQDIILGKIYKKCLKNLLEEIGQQLNSTEKHEFQDSEYWKGVFIFLSNPINFSVKDYGF